MIPAAFPRSLGDMRTRWKLRRCAEIGAGAEALGKIWIHGGGKIRIGERARLDGRWAPIELHAAPGAEIVIADGVEIDGGASIEAERSVRIGEGAHVGRFCKILDNHFHRVDARSERPSSQAVVVEEEAWLGAKSILLPGAYVGRGTIVREGTVLTRRVPHGAVVAGQPASVRRSS